MRCPNQNEPVAVDGIEAALDALVIETGVASSGTHDRMRLTLPAIRLVTTVLAQPLMAMSRSRALRSNAP